MKPLSLTFALFFLLSQPGFAGDWPQYRGPQRNDRSTETGLLQAWPEGGPRLLWTFRNAGAGYSGPAVVGQRVYLTGARGEREYLIALDLRTVTNGSVAEAWAAEIGPKFDWDGNKWSAGPSATPTVTANVVYGLGGNGDLICVEATLGKGIWRKNLPAEASTSGWKENGRFTIPQQSALRKPSGKIWTPPVVAGGRLFLRDQELVFCYDLAAGK